MSDVRLPDQPSTGHPVRPSSWERRRQRGLRPKPHGDVAHTTRLRLWLPLTPLWMLLAPFALLLAPLVTLTPRLAPHNRRVQEVRTAITAHPYQAAFALGAVLLSMSGTVVSVEAPGASIHIRIF